MKVKMKIPNAIIKLPEEQRYEIAEELTKALGFRDTITKQELEQHMWQPDPNPNIAKLEDLYYENLAVPLWYTMLEVYDLLGLEFPEIEELPVEMGIEKALKAERCAYLTTSSKPIYIPINRIRTPYQTDEAINKAKVASIEKLIRSQEELPPLIIGYNYDLHDGHHRLVASQNLGLTHVPCVVRGLEADKIADAVAQYRSLYKSTNIPDENTFNVRVLEKGFGNALQEKYPGGRWVTMNGSHVFIKPDGTPSEETIPEGLKDADTWLGKMTSLAQESTDELDFASRLADPNGEYFDEWDYITQLFPNIEGSTMERIRKFWKMATDGGKIFTGNEYKNYPGNYKDIKVQQIAEIPKIQLKPVEGHHAEASVNWGKQGVEITLGKVLDEFYDDEKLDDAVHGIITHEVGHVLSNLHRDLERQILDNPGGALGRYNRRKHQFEGVTFVGCTPEESWAEAYALYNTDPEYLKEKYPEAYAMVDHILAQIPYHKDILRQVYEDFYANYRVRKSLDNDLEKANKDDNSDNKKRFLGKVRHRYQARLRYRPDGKPYTLRQMQDLEKVLRKYQVDPRVFAESMAVRSTIIGKLLAERDVTNTPLMISMIENMPTRIEQVRKPFVLKQEDGTELQVLPLQPQEINAIEWATQFSGEHIRATQEDLISGVKLLVAQARRERWEPNKLQQELFDRFGKYNRDWRRIALTELAEATNNGYLLQLKDGEMVIGQSAVDCCDACLTLVDKQIYKYRTEPGDPDSEIWVGKSNAGLKRRAWKPAVIIHPHCRCRWTRINTDFFKVENGEVKQKTADEILAEIKERKQNG